MIEDLGPHKKKMGYTLTTENEGGRSKKLRAYSGSPFDLAPLIEEAIHH